MKKTILIGVLAVAGVAMTSCDDFLNKNRYPLTVEVNSPAYWGNEANVQLQVDRLYNTYQGYGNGTGTGGWFYFKTLSDDQAGGSFADWANTNIPASAGTFSDPFTYIRGIQIVLNGLDIAEPQHTPAKRANFEGICRLNRAWQYYQLVRMYGDVPVAGTYRDGQIDFTLVDTDDNEILYGPRVNRDIVMDYVVADLDYAAANISAQNNKQFWSKDLALAMKAEVCLYEGTYSKYRTLADNGQAPDAARANKYLTEAANAAGALINSGRYSLNTKTASGTYNGYAYNFGAYQYNYNQDLAAAKANTEFIWFKGYNNDVFMHSTIDYTCSSTVLSGMTKDAFDSYLFKDGKPLALTSEDKSDVGEVDADGNYSIAKLLAVRDQRLAGTIDPIVFYKGMGWARGPIGSMEMTSTTGYGVSKYDNPSFPINSRSTAAKNYSCAPMFWLATVYLQYAEAKAELGTLTDADLNLTLNKLYARAGLPDQTVSSLSSMNDPANNMGISSLLWEVRRCRRCELMFDNWSRYWDLVRWHQLNLLDSKQYPNILLGANMTKAPVEINNVNGYVDGSNGGVRTYEARQYFYPIPSNQISLNHELTQNPGWK